MREQIDSIREQIFSVKRSNFDALALAVFRYQAAQNPIYKAFLKYLNVQPEKVSSLTAIPFLPIEAFKKHKIISGVGESSLIFSSSGTTNQTITSQHYVLDELWYQKSFLQAFELFYGAISDYCILALLPAYLERKGSSLVYMAQHLIQQSQHPASGFYLYNYEDLIEQLQALEAAQQATILLGVSFALWDLAEKYPMNLKHTIIMETGGMKGRRKELVRSALHDIFKQGFQVNQIHSEYGMTELLSQAYSKGNGIFHSPPWMKVMIREVNDPFAYVLPQQTGCLNIIDLANIDSCAFIATSDLGRMQADGGFEVLGRLDHSDVRGCNLMVV